MIHHRLTYWLIRALGWPLQKLPHAFLIKLGALAGICLYYLDRERRKRALSNLSIASFAPPLTFKEKVKIAKGSFVTLGITCFEFFYLHQKKGKTDHLVRFENFEVAQEVLAVGKGLILFAAHQANWEAPFLAMCSHTKGMAIGKPIKNQFLYKWILSIRESQGGQLITPQEAMKEGVKALRLNQFIGVVGDQALSQSSYFYPLFGMRAWTSTAPALLSCRTGAAVVPVSVKRDKDHYVVHFFRPIWPDSKASLKTEMKRIMDDCMKNLEYSIRLHPEQWLWQHNRWKQGAESIVQKSFRHDFILVVLPLSLPRFQRAKAQLSILRSLYPSAFFYLFIPKGLHLLKQNGDSHFYYHNPLQTFLDDWRFQMVFDFENIDGLGDHYLDRGAFQVFTLKRLKLLASQKGYGGHDPALQLRWALCKSHYLQPYA